MWLINFLKWKIAGKELDRLHQLETDLRSHRRWLTMFDHVAAVLDNLASRNGVEGGFNKVRPLSVEELREKLRRCTPPARLPKNGGE